MLFNSIDFALFLPITFLVYWFVFKKNLKLQNLFLTISSYIFYGWWDWRFLSLILFSTIVDYFVGNRIVVTENKSKRKFLLWISITTNVGLLAFFKYYDFFLESFVDVFTFFGMQIQANTLNLILPIGISFYTFQTLSYTLDIYYKRLKPTKDFIAFSAFVCFFPQLVAGPIERASNFLPQFLKHRKFNYMLAADGMRQILWGVFKKVVIADNCGEFANEIFNNSSQMNGSTLLLGLFFFSFQIYGDFSGYSDIAIGTSRLFGFNLRQNFAAPYFSKNIVEFWRRWHISLTSWLTDYIFTPLALSLRNYERKGILFSITLTFLLSGLWHGAGWNFVVYGLTHAFYYLLTISIIGHKKLFKKQISKNKLIPSFNETISMLFTFLIVSFSYIFFRAEDMNHAIRYINGIFSIDILSFPEFYNEKGALVTLLLLLVFIIVEWLGRENQYAIESLSKYSSLLRFVSYIILILFIFYFMSSNPTEFIYFQF